MIISEVMTDIHTDPNSTYRLGPSGKMGRVKTVGNNRRKVILHAFYFLFFLETHKFMVFGERSLFGDKLLSPFNPIPDMSGMIDGEHLHFLRLILSSSIE